MNKRILFVDDDEKILRSVTRGLKDSFEVETALGPRDGLKQIQEGPAFAVVVSDLKMPEMNGIDFLKQVSKIRPDTVRVMLTGYADVDTAIAAVNKGQIFRFLTKPCDTETLQTSLDAAIGQYHLVTSERILLERTLKGCIEVLIETLSLVNEEAYGRATRLRRFLRVVLAPMNVKKMWKYELAAMLSQLGYLVLSEEATRKIALGATLKGEELQLFEMAPQIGQNLLAKIPRMEEIAKIVAYQQKNYDGTGLPRDDLAGEDIPLGARGLKLVSDFDTEVAKGKSWGEAFLTLEKHAGRYDPLLMYHLEGSLGIEARYKIMSLPVSKIRTGMVLHQDVETADGVSLVRKSLEVNSVMLQRLKGFAETTGIREPIEVLVPLSPSE